MNYPKNGAKTNLGNSEPRQVAGEPSLQSGHGANKRRRHDQNQNGGVDDGPKYPQEKATIVSFECLFCKGNPHRYPECRGLRLTRLSDVIQHIKRQHLLVEVRLGSETALPEHVILYCPRCRCLFRGLGAAFRLEAHTNQKVKCQQVNIDQSGVMLHGELEDIKLELGSCKGKSEWEKWFIIWVKCYPGKDPPLSPYAEISVPRQQVESILQNELESTRVLKPEQVQSIVKRSADRIYKPTPQPRSSPSVPPQAQSNIVQAAPVSNYLTPTYLPSNPTHIFQPLQTRTQGLDYSLGQPSAGLYGKSTGGQEENSFDWNNTLTHYSVPSPVQGSGAYTNPGPGYFPAHDSVYTHAPYVGDLNGSFQSTSQNNDYPNTYGNDMGPHSSQN